MDKKQAFHEIETKRNSVPVEAIDFLYNHPADKEIFNKVKFFIENAYNDDVMYNEKTDIYSSASLWYAIVAEKHNDETLLDAVVDLFFADDDEVWDFLTEQASYLIGVLSEKYKDTIPSKVLDIIEELIIEESDVRYLYMFEAFPFLDLEKEQERLLTILTDGYFIWVAPYVQSLSALKLEGLKPIIQNLIEGFNEVTSNEEVKFLIIEFKEALKMFEEQDKPYSFYLQRESWKTYYKEREDYFMD